MLWRVRHARKRLGVVSGFDRIGMRENERGSENGRTPTNSVSLRGGAFCVLHRRPLSANRSADQPAYPYTPLRFPAGQNLPLGCTAFFVMPSEACV